MKEIIDLLHKGNYSCVITNKEDIRTFTQRGVADLYFLLKNDFVFLKGAVIADKIIGKAAASLMILGQVQFIYTDTISTPALELLKKHDMQVDYLHEVPFIENRDKSGWCPMEKLCYQEDTVEAVLCQIEGFIEKMRKQNI